MLNPQANIIRLFYENGIVGTLLFMMAFVIGLILAVLAIGVLLNVFSPIIGVKSAFAGRNMGCPDVGEHYSCMTFEQLNNISQQFKMVEKYSRGIREGKCPNSKLCNYFGQ